MTHIPVPGFPGFKFVFTSSVLVFLLGWFSIFGALHSSSFDLHHDNCPHAREQHLQEWKQESSKAFSSGIQLPSNQTSAHPKRRLRVLMGIFTFDKKVQFPYRRQFRKLFDVFPKNNDTRVCSLYDFENAPNEELRYQCQFIYTFVVGGLKDQQARMELVDDSAPIVLETKTNLIQPDLKEYNDVTVLNIRENMNQGKSQTWFKYATTILDKYDLDYAGKMDSDSLPYMDKFFHYAYTYLPPPPYNSGIIAGVPIDKLWWSRNKIDFIKDENEDFFKQAYGKVMHLYAAGQCYILSRDLCHTVVLEAPNSHPYREGHEDHDISAMAFHSTVPMSFHFLSLQQQFWRHPVKRLKNKTRKWRTTWHNENMRLKKVLNLRQEHLKASKNADDEEEEDTPDQLAAPVQVALDENEEGEEEDADEDGSDKGEVAEEIAEE